MDYSIEYAKKVLEEMKKPENKFCGICDAMGNCRDAITTNKIWNTINFIKSQFPEETYELVYDEKATPIGFKRSETLDFRFVSQTERINFLRKIVFYLKCIDNESKQEVENEQEIKNKEIKDPVVAKLNWFQRLIKWLWK